MVADLMKRAPASAEESEGALVTSASRTQLGRHQEPCSYDKTMGASLYATTDIAAVRGGVQKFNRRQPRLLHRRPPIPKLRQFFGRQTKGG